MMDFVTFIGESDARYQTLCVFLALECKKSEK